MTTAKQVHYSYAEYLRALEDSHIKLEYLDGVIYAMAGGTVAHAQLSVAAGSILRASLGNCRVFSSDLKVQVEATGLNTFPDASVVCGELHRSKLDANTILNPTLLVEVTSKSTEDYDRGDKLSHYKKIPSVRAVLFVSHRTKAITVVERTAGGWSEREVRSGERITLTDPALTLAVDDVYTGVELEPD